MFLIEMSESSIFASASKPVHCSNCTRGLYFACFTLRLNMRPVCEGFAIVLETSERHVVLCMAQGPGVCCCFPTGLCQRDPDIITDFPDRCYGRC